MTKATWHEGPTPPKFEEGLPSEIHFWKVGLEIYLLRNGVWHVWPKGVAVKDVGKGYGSHNVWEALHG